MPRILLLSLMVIIMSQNMNGQAVESATAEVKKDKIVRESILAGTWYPKTAEALQKEVDGFLAKAPEEKKDAFPVKALVAPHAGYEWSGPTAAFAYKAIKDKKYKRVVLLGPSHRKPFQGGALPGVDAFETPLGEIPIDTEACNLLLKNSAFSTLPSAHAQEHSLEIQLPFLQRTLSDFKLVPIVVGEITPENAVAMANAIRPLLDKDTLLLLSSDFTHQGSRFGYTPFKENIKANIQKMDFMAVNFILNLDVSGFWEFLNKTQATICGQNPIKIGMLALSAQTQVDFTKYATSGEKTGDEKETVSYVSLVFRDRPEYLDAKEEKLLLQSARKTLEDTFKNNTKSPYYLPDDQVTEHLKDKKGVFVTLNENGELRGCIGQLFAGKDLSHTVSDTALLSAFGDHRFETLEPEELKKIDIEISVMSPMKKVTDWKDIVLGRDGMRIMKNGRSALFLPQVALEQGWNLEETLQYLCRKAGMDSMDYKSGAEFETFTAQVFGEKFLDLQGIKE